VYQDDITNFCRMVRYLELLESNPTGITKGAFERMCSFLEKSSDKHWISDELRTELKTVKGELVIENYAQNWSWSLRTTFERWSL